MLYHRVMSHLPISNSSSRWSGRAAYIPSAFCQPHSWWIHAACREKSWQSHPLPECLATTAMLMQALVCLIKFLKIAGNSFTQRKWKQTQVKLGTRCIIYIYIYVCLCTWIYIVAWYIIKVQPVSATELASKVVGTVLWLWPSQLAQCIYKKQVKTRAMWNISLVLVFDCVMTDDWWVYSCLHLETPKNASRPTTLSYITISYYI